MFSVGLRRGDVVEVKSAAEIQATLDVRGQLDGLPFMPEMVQFCGRRFVVERRAERVCDTIHYSGSRRLPDAVILSDLRCDGSAHGGCQAECRIYWKEAWLSKVRGGPLDTATVPVAGDLEALRERTAAYVLSDARPSSERRWTCQATELARASRALRLWDLRSYVREYLTGNVTLAQFVRITARAMVQEPMRKLGLIPEVPLPGTRVATVTDPPLNLQPGELVQVKPRAEIATTLTPSGRHRGLWFDREMMQFCGGTFRVRQRVQRIIDERDGRMIELKGDCVTLEGVVCSGELSLRRWFCPRAIFPFWRETWLRRADAGASAPSRPGLPGKGPLSG